MTSYFRQVATSAVSAKNLVMSIQPDVLFIDVETNDYPSIVEETVRQIKGDFGRISGIFSINCIFRYLFFSQERYMDQYLKTMGTLGMHAGLVGFGEHYNSQFVNQTMSCVVFE